MKHIFNIPPSKQRYYDLALYIAFSVSILLSIKLRLALFGDLYESDIGAFISYVKRMHDYQLSVWMSTHFTKLSTLFLYIWYPISQLDGNFLYPLKGFNSLFDYLCAYWCYRIVRLRYTNSYTLPLLAATLVIWVPTTPIISALWGQVDNVYTSFLLASIYFFMRMHSPQRTPHDSLWGIFMFSIAFAFKLQSIVLVPALAFFVGARMIPLWYGAIPFVVYFIIQLPRVAFGYPIDAAFLGYTQQIELIYTISERAPNPYMFIRMNLPSWITTADTIGKITGPALSLAALYLGHRIYKLRLNTKFVLWTCSLSLFLTPYILTRMHERYFFPADILSIVLPFFSPQLWPIPIIANATTIATMLPRVHLVHILTEYFPFLSYEGTVLLMSLAVGGITYFWYRQYRYFIKTH